MVRELDNSEVAFLIGDNQECRRLMASEPHPIKTMKARFDILVQTCRSDDWICGKARYLVIFRDTTDNSIWKANIYLSVDSGWKYGWTHIAELMDEFDQPVEDEPEDDFDD